MVISLEEKIKLLERNKIFQNIPRHFYEVIASRMGERKYDSERMVFQYGAEGDSLILVYDGAVDILASNGKLLACLGKGEIVGEMAVLSKQKRSASVRAKGDLHVLFFKAEAFRKLIHEIPDLSLAFTEILVERLNVANKKLMERDSLPEQPASEEISFDIDATRQIRMKGHKCLNCFEYNYPEASVCAYCESPLEKYKTIRSFIVAIICIVMLAASIKGYFWLASLRKPLTRNVEKKSLLVRSMEVATEDIAMVVEGFGRVRPATEVTIVAQAKGRITNLHKLFKAGYFVKKGELLVEIDPSDYQSEIRRLSRSIAAQRSKMKLLGEEFRNLQEEIKIARQLLDLSKEAQVRNEKLYRRDGLGRTDYDAFLKDYLNNQNNLTSLKNRQTGLSQKMVDAKEALKNFEHQLSQEKKHREFTRIYAPFDGRIQETYVTQGSIAQINQRIVVLEDNYKVEIPVIISQSKLPNLFPTSSDLNEIQKNNLNIPAIVAHTLEGNNYNWQGSVVRIAPFKEKDGTVPIIVKVESPWNHKDNPPLQNNHFVKVQVSGRKLQNVITIPRYTLRQNNTVYVVKNGVLEIRTVIIQHYIGDKLVISSGLEVGDVVVLTNIPFPLIGMPLRTVKDKS